MKELLEESSLVLMEAAIVEQLRHSGHVKLHELLANAPLIYEQDTRAAMADLYRQYMTLARQAGLPFLACTPTWRAGRDRVEQSGVSQTINQDAAAFLQEIRLDDNVRIGGMIGCKNDCYRPEAGLSSDEAEQFHAWQVMQLIAGKVDFLIAVTLPNVQEAFGIARAMAASKKPYIISFVIGRDGRILDGTALEEAMAMIDGNTDVQPLGYMVNCAHPSFFRPNTQSPQSYSRLLGFQGNASALDHSELENADTMHVDNIAEWGDRMLEMNHNYGVKILGGCCGTGIEHLEYLVENRSD